MVGAGADERLVWRLARPPHRSGWIRHRLFIAGSSLAVALSLAVGPTVAAAPAFRDLGGVPWAAPYINDLAARGIMRGVAPGVFDPQGMVTRGELALVVARTWPSTTATAAPAFADVTAGSALGRALRTAWPLIEPILGPLGRFGPDSPVQRQQVFAILGRIEVPTSPSALIAQSQSSYILSRFRDGSRVNPGLAGWVAAAIATGIVRGTPGGDLDPLAGVTRAGLAVMVDRASPGSYFGTHSVTVVSPNGTGSMGSRLP